jgi:hypothetical protein
VPERDLPRVAREVRRRHGLQQRERDLVGAHRAGERVRGDRGHQLGGSDDDPGLGPAQELVARERHERGAGVERLADARFVAQPRRAVPEPRRRVVEQPGPGVDHHRHPERGQLRHRRRLDETHHAVVRRVHLEDERGVGVERIPVVGEARAVGGSHLDEPAARLRHDLGDSEPAADLHQLAPRHDHGPTAGERTEREEHGGRVVVHDDAGIGPTRAREQRSRMVVTRPALT